MYDLLIIDDDESLTELLDSFFTGNGYKVRIANNSSEGLRNLFNVQPDLVILDVTMPERNGWETLERIREVSKIPVVMLTSRSDEQDILRGFSQGADDYVTKPFSFAQLAARVQAILLRINDQSEENNIEVLKYGDLSIDFRTHQVTRGKEKISLSPTEFKLLVTLMKRESEVVPAEDIVIAVWGPQYAGEVGHVRRYIWHLRKKIEIDSDNPKYIHNDRGYGYRFQVS